MLRKIFLGIVFVMIVSLLGPPISSGANAQTSCIEKWVVEYDGPPQPGGDYAYFVVVDADGNVIVSGQSPEIGQNNDYLTIKYDATTGGEVWKHRYNGTANGQDYVNDIAIDSAGNVYVTGQSEGSETGYDYLTIMYPVGYIGGDLEAAGGWIHRQVGNGIDVANAIAVDSDGNVYVAGTNGNDDYFIVKYPTGYTQGDDPVLFNPYDRAGNFDGANDIAVDKDGYVYVTGGSVGDTSTDDLGVDYITLKYDSEGTLLAVSDPYDGPGHTGDTAYAVALYEDPELEEVFVYVTGTSVGDGTGYSDYATIGYDSDLNTLWVARYDGAQQIDSVAGEDALVIDSDGYVYVTGRSEGAGGSTDFLTLKYNGQTGGDSIWEARYDGGLSDTPESMDLYEERDELGNLVVSLYVTGSCNRPGTGYDYCTVKYDGVTGAQVGGSVHYNDPVMNGGDYANAVAVDRLTGNVAVTGSSEGYGTSDDYLTILYDEDFNRLWSGLDEGAARYNGWGAPSLDHGFGIAVDKDGNVCVTGRSGGGTFYDYYTVMYDSDGNRLWDDRYNSELDNTDMAYDVAVDEDGNFYVTGASFRGEAPGTRFDYYTIKYDPAGNRVWEAQYHNTDSVGTYYTPNDFAYRIIVDEDGNVYVTGDTFTVNAEGESPTRDYGTVKYDSAGNLMWAVQYDNGGDDGAPWYRGRMAVDSAGNVYVTGYSFGSGDTSYDAGTVKYDKDGNEVWRVRYNGLGSGYDSGRGIAVDGKGNVYVSGPSFSGSETTMDYFIAKYDKHGNEVWVYHYDGGRDIPWHMVSDADGNLYVTGMSRAETNWDYATIKVDTDGNLVWAARYDGGGTDDRAEAIAVDACGNAYVTGRSEVGGEYEWDYVTVMYDCCGNEVCVSRYPRPGVDDPWDIAIDAWGNAYISGGSWRGPNDYVIVKYGAKYSADPKCQIANLICKVENLVNTGVLKQQKGNGLIAKLNEALKNLNKAKPNRQAACNKLSDFIDQVNSYINSGILTPIQGQALIDAANIIINELCG